VVSSAAGQYCAQVGRLDLAAFGHPDGERLREAIAVATLRAHGSATLADLTVRAPRRRQRWNAIPGLARQQDRSLGVRLLHEFDGSAGAYRAPRPTCTLDAENDYQAAQTWLLLHKLPVSIGER
jgi:hypothetical protein